MKIEHLGIAVKSLGLSDDLFAKLLGKNNYKQESVEREGVTTSFYEVGESKIELLEATNPESPIAKFIDKKGEGIHHIAFGVEDIYEEIERLKARRKKLQAQLVEARRADEALRGKKALALVKEIAQGGVDEEALMERAREIVGEN